MPPPRRRCLGCRLPHWLLRAQPSRLPASRTHHDLPTATHLPTRADSIYREDVALKDPNLSFRGLRTYRLIFWGLRLHARLLLSAAHVQVLRIWQPEDAVIK